MNVVNNRGTTALMQAALKGKNLYDLLLTVELTFFKHFFKGFEDIVQILIEKGADVNNINNKGSSALLYASLSGNN